MAFLDQIGADGGATGDYPPFIDEEGKKELMENQHPFFVIDANPKRASAFGDQTWFVVKFGTIGKTTTTQTGEKIIITAPGWAANAESWTMSSTWNEDREDQARKILAAIAGDENSFVGPCFLHGVPTKSGKTYQKIRGVRDEHPQPVAASSGGATPQMTPVGGSPPIVADEDIPFLHDDAFRVTL